MSKRFIISEEEEKRVAYLSTLFASLPVETDPDFDTLSVGDQDFLASVRRQFDIWQDLSIGQEESLEQLSLKWREREVSHED